MRDPQRGKVAYACHRIPVYVGQACDHLMAATALHAPRPGRQVGRRSGPANPTPAGVIAIAEIVDRNVAKPDLDDPTTPAEDTLAGIVSRLYDCRVALAPVDDRVHERTEQLLDALQGTPWTSPRWYVAITGARRATEAFSSTVERLWADAWRAPDDLTEHILGAVVNTLGQIRAHAHTLRRRTADLDPSATPDARKSAEMDA